jgi:hypothetical protein
MVRYCLKLWCWSGQWASLDQCGGRHDQGDKMCRLTLTRKRRCRTLLLTNMFFPLEYLYTWYSALTSCSASSTVAFNFIHPLLWLRPILPGAIPFSKGQFETIWTVSCELLGNLCAVQYSLESPDVGESEEVNAKSLVERYLVMVKIEDEPPSGGTYEELKHT